jgi:hypothetical protein
MGRELWQHNDTELLHALRELETRMRRDYAQALDLIAELDIRDTAATHGYSTMWNFCGTCCACRAPRPIGASGTPMP